MRVPVGEPRAIERGRKRRSDIEALGGLDLRAGQVDDRQNLVVEEEGGGSRTVMRQRQADAARVGHQKPRELTARRRLACGAQSAVGAAAVRRLIAQDAGAVRSQSQHRRELVGQPRPPHEERHAITRCEHPRREREPQIGVEPPLDRNLPARRATGSRVPARVGGVDRQRTDADRRDHR